MLRVLVLLTVVSAAHIQNKTRTPHWENVCNTSLFFSDDKKNWNDAQEFCDFIGGNLVDIRSQEMNYCILRHAHHSKVPEDIYWHSANDIVDEGVYHFGRTGDLILWSPMWYPPDPNAGRAGNCIMFWLTNNKFAGLWADDICSAAYRYVCQRKH